MLIQRFSLKALFILMTLVSMTLLMLPYALRGSPGGGPAGCLLFSDGHLAPLCSRFLHYLADGEDIWYRGRVTPQSPFASDVPPKQIIPPMS
jgi:hypothetical protein